MMSIMENIDLTKVVTVPDIQKTCSCIDPHWYGSIGDTDGDVEIPEEFYQNIPEIATRWDNYNEKNWWDSRRFYRGKYEIVACTGTPEDYTYETVDSTNKWKEARKMYNMGADIYCGDKLVHFVDHKAVQQAYDDLTFDEIVGFDIDADSAFEADVQRKSAYDVLDQNGLNADETWKKKIETRYEYRVFKASYGIPFHARSITCLFNPKTGKYENTRIETDELPF